MNRIFKLMLATIPPTIVVGIGMIAMNTSMIEGIGLVRALCTFLAGLSMFVFGLIYGYTVYDKYRDTVDDITRNES